MLKNSETNGLSMVAIQALIGEQPKTEKTYSATEVGAMFGVTSQKIGRIANAYGLKTEEYGITVLDKSPYSNKEVTSFRYNQKGVDRIKEILDTE